MVQLGVRGHDYGRDTPSGLFGRIRADGFSCVQLALKKAIGGVEKFSDITPEVLKAVNLARQKTRITVSVLGVYVEPSLAEEKLRLESVAELIGSIPFAKELEAVCIGTETTQMQKQPGVTRKEAQNALLRSLSEIMPAAEENGVTVALEPVFTHTVGTPELSEEVLRAIRSPKLKIIFDPANLLSAEDLPSQRRLWGRCFECFGSEIAAVHLKGICPDGKGGFVECSFRESVLDYNYIFAGLRKLPQDYDVLREGIRPAEAEGDLRFMQGLLK